MSFLQDLRATAGKCVLVGPMGSGKSLIGKHLARELELPFVDSDTVICQKAGLDIPSIFANEGEEGFRLRETEVLHELLAAPRSLLLASGGGSVLFPANRALFKAQSVCIFLDISPEKQQCRVAHDHNRPLLQHERLLAQLRELRQKRFPYYQDVADIYLCTDSKKPRQVVEELLALLQRQDCDKGERMNAGDCE